MKKNNKGKFSKVYDWTFVEDVGQYLKEIEQYFKEEENEKL